MPELNRRLCLQTLLLSASGLPMAHARSASPDVANRAYGPHPRQVLDLYRPGGRADAHAPPPLMVFVHGGAWSMGDKRSAADTASAFNGIGFAFAALNYRFHPEVTPQAQAQDVARALAHLQRHASALGVNAQRLCLMGHSAGAHLAALTALDPSYLLEAAVPAIDLKAVVLLDGAGYDIARQMGEGENGRLYRQVFGSDPAVHRALSPLTYAGQPRPGGAAFQIHHVARRDSSRQQAQSLAQRIQQVGGVAEVHAAQKESHASINRGFGERGDSTTQKTLAFVRRYAAMLRSD